MLGMVAPLVGAWIEILTMSGLIFAMTVAPLVGAWIEIMDVFLSDVQENCRSSRGSVD